MQLLKPKVGHNLKFITVAQLIQCNKTSDKCWHLVNFEGILWRQYKSSWYTKRGSSAHWKSKYAVYMHTVMYSQFVTWLCAVLSATRGGAPPSVTLSDSVSIVGAVWNTGTFSLLTENAFFVHFFHWCRQDFGLGAAEYALVCWLSTPVGWVKTQSEDSYRFFPEILAKRQVC